MKIVDVVVVGAGPVGLLTAIELTLGGVRVLVLERLAAPSMVTKAFSVGALGSEALQRRGMEAAMDAAEERTFAEMQKFLEESGATGRGPDQRGKGPKFSGHFAGLTLIRKDAQKEPERRAHIVDQHAVEAMLADRAHALGIEVLRGCEVTSFVQHEDGWHKNGQDSGIDVEWVSAEGAGRIRCSWLVGCDGGRSSIRKMAGFEFPGTDPTLTMYTAFAEIDHPERLLPIGWRRTSGGVFSYGPFPGRLFLLDFSGPPKDREAPVTREEVESVLRRISGMDVRVKTLASGSRWTDNTRLVETYRRGRVLLAGDAAHIHSPFGGQGMSLGLVDAQNLGWKLAAVVRGEMPESLLDSYTAERRPVAEAVLANTLAQTAIMRPDPQSGAMRELMAKLMQFNDVNQLIGEMMSGLATRYDLGCDSGSNSGDTEPRIGRLIGDLQISQVDGKSTLYELMQDGMGVLFDASTEKSPSKLAQAGLWRVHCAAVGKGVDPGIGRGVSMLIRPDACIAWAGEEDNTDGLAEALHRWFIPARGTDASASID